MSGEYTPESLLADLDAAQKEILDLKQNLEIANRENDRIKSVAKNAQDRLTVLTNKYTELDTRFEQMLDKLVDKI